MKNLLILSSFLFLFLSGCSNIEDGYVDPEVSFNLCDTFNTGGPDTPPLWPLDPIDPTDPNPPTDPDYDPDAYGHYGSNWGSNNCLTHFWKSMQNRNSYSEGFAAGKEAIYCLKDAYRRENKNAGHTVVTDPKTGGIKFINSYWVMQRKLAASDWYILMLDYYKTMSVEAEWFRGYYMGFKQYTYLEERYMGPIQPQWINPQDTFPWIFPGNSADGDL